MGKDKPGGPTQVKENKGNKQTNKTNKQKNIQ